MRLLGFVHDEVARVAGWILGLVFVAPLLLAACNAGDDRQASRASNTTPTISTNELAEGSGCTPGTDHLPDGTWYGQVVATGLDEIEFDLACWFISDGAVVASAEDGQESPPPNGYYVRNDNLKIRTVPVAGNVPVTWYGIESGDPSNETIIDYTNWMVDRQDRSYQLPVWLTVESGLVIQIQEQWTP